MTKKCYFEKLSQSSWDKEARRWSDLGKTENALAKNNNQGQLLCQRIDIGGNLSSKIDF